MAKLIEILKDYSHIKKRVLKLPAPQPSFKSISIDVRPCFFKQSPILHLDHYTFILRFVKRIE